MLERIPSEPPYIAPLAADDRDRPLFSIMIPVYNCSGYLEKCLTSVLMQDMGAKKMQIEVIDDCSTDADVGAIVQSVGKGRIGYYRKEKNMGSLRNFESCINRSRGHLVHILHGDDFLKDGFYREIEKLYKLFPEVGAAFTDYYYVDVNSKGMYADERLLTRRGILKDWLLYIAAKQRIQPPAMVVRRTTYEQLGGFYAVKYGEDWEMWARIAASYEVAHSPKYLACYRVHNNNITGQSLASGQNIKDIKKVMSIIEGYLPEEKRKEIMLKAKKNFSVYYAWMAHAMYHHYQDDSGALRQISGALSMHTSPETLKLAAKLYAKLLIRYKR